MKKVDFNANTEWLYQQNWRLLQRALVELDIRDYVRILAQLYMNHALHRQAMESPPHSSSHLQPGMWFCKQL